MQYKKEEYDTVYQVNLSISILISSKLMQLTKKRRKEEKVKKEILHCLFL